MKTFVFERRSAVGWEECQVDGALADTLLEGLDVWLYAFEVGFHDFVVLFDSGLDHFSAVFLGFFEHVSGNFLNSEILRLAGIVPDVGFHGHEIDDTDEIGFRADRENHDERSGTEDFFHLVNDAVEIGSDTVEFVDVDDTGDFRVVRVAPVSLGLWLNAAGSAENANAAVENFKGAINFDGEVNVAWGVDDVELVAVPETSSRGGLNGNTALGFLIHEVHGGFAVVNFADFMDFSGEFKNALGGGGFAGVNVGENADVAVF